MHARLLQRQSYKFDTFLQFVADVGIFGLYICMGSMYGIGRPIIQ